MSHSVYRGFCLSTAILILSTAVSFAQKYVENGIAIEFSARPAGTGAPASLRENSDISFRFRVSEEGSGNALGSRRIAAWIDRAGTLASASSCQDKVKGFLEGSFFYRPAADLNSYYVLTLNREPSLSVVDPLVSYGETHELTTVVLPSPGIDWVVDSTHGRVLVTLPDLKKIAVVDTSNWKLSRTLDVPGRPARILLEPDGQYFWVAWSSENADAPSGVAVYNAATFAMTSRIVTGRGSHELAFTGDNHFALVTNRDSGDVVTIDVRKLAVVQREHTGREPTSIAFSTLSGMAYVSDTSEGTVTALGITKGAKPVTIAAEPGVGPIRFAPNGRLGFALNSAKDLVYIIDAATNRIIQTADVEKSPDQIVFSNELAYIRHGGSETVLMVPLAAVGEAGAAVHVADFPAGQHPLGANGHPSLADGIVQAPGENAVWVANAADRMIYYYMEGMAAPKGSFAIAEEPRAVMVVDRSLQQTSPGVYETTARLPASGKYTVAMLLDNPQTIHCFDVSVEADPDKHPLPRRSVDVQLVAENTGPIAGTNSRIRLRFLDAATGKPKSDLKDVRVLTYLPPGQQDRLNAEPVGDGVYEIEFRPPEPGIYQVFVECPSMNLTYSTLPGWHLEVGDAAAKKQP